MPRLRQVVLERRLRDALGRLNPDLPVEALEDAFRKLTRLEGADLVSRNRAMHRLLVDGVTVEYRTAEGEIGGAQAPVVDFENAEADDWLAVNQFTVAENKHSRRPDIVLFVNGLARHGAQRARATLSSGSSSAVRPARPARPRPPPRTRKVDAPPRFRVDF